MKMCSCEKKEIAEVLSCEHWGKDIRLQRNILNFDLPIFLTYIFLLNVFFLGTIYIHNIYYDLNIYINLCFFNHSKMNIYFLSTSLEYVSTIWLYLWTIAMKLYFNDCVLYFHFIGPQCVLLSNTEGGNAICKRYDMLSRMKWLYIHMNVPWAWIKNSYNY